MGIFGVIASLIGLGSAAKDAIVDTFDDAESRSKAEIKGNPVYYASGYKMRSTQTGENCSLQMDSKSNHLWVVDNKTGEKITDYTRIINSRKTEENKIKAEAKGSCFYRTCEYDGKFRSDIYINDRMPGKHFNRKFTWTYTTYTCEETNQKYFEDGTLYSADIAIERMEAKEKQKALENGCSFYRCFGEDNNNSIYYRNIKDNKPYIYNAARKYFVEAELEVVEGLFRDEKILFAREVVGGRKYNEYGDQL